jgi:hypothetical protein
MGNLQIQPGNLENLLLKPSLRKMPNGMSTTSCGIGSGVLILTSENSNQKGIVRFGYPSREVGNGYIRRELIRSSIGKNVVGESSLSGLINVEHVNLVVPRPWIERRAIRILIYEAWAIFRPHGYQRAEAWPTSHPNCQRRICRIFARFEKPEE